MLQIPQTLPRMFNKTPPHSPESEMSLLGCMLIDATISPEVARIVSAEDFYDPRHARIFTAIGTIFSRDGQVDAVTIRDAVATDTPECAAIGIEYIVGLAETTPSPMGFSVYARIVADKAKLRRLIRAAGEIIHAAHHADTDDTSKTISWAFEQISPLARIVGGNESVTLQAAAEQVVTALESGKANNLRTGFRMFDEIASGVPRSGLWTIFGYPGGGKTTFALASALNFARGISINGQKVQERTLVRYYSVEQGPMRAAATLLSQQSGLGIHGFLNQGGATENDINQIAEASFAFAGCDFGFIENSLDPVQLFTECSALATRHPHGVLVVDYIQDMPPFGKFIETTPRMTETMRILSRIARELGWLVVCVSQVSKSAGNANLSPKMTDGLGSSAIEQRSDLISYVWRPHIREERPSSSGCQQFGGIDPLMVAWEARRKRTRIGILKNKYGPLGHAELQFEAKSMQFVEPTENVSVYWEKLENV